MRFKRCFVGLCLLGVFSGPNAGEPDRGPVDPALVAALKQAVEGVHNPPQQLDAMLWLAEKSRLLASHIPDPFYRVRLLRIIHEEAVRAGLDPKLVLAVIQVESRFDRFSVSRSGARGLMQIMPFWKKEIGHPDDNLFHPQTNLRYGCTILRYYIDQHRGEVAPALAAYNGSLGKPDYPDKVYLALRDRWQPQVTK